MKDIIPFDYHGKTVRTVTLKNEPWFIAKDVCDVLDVQNVTQAIERLDDDERSMFNIGRQGETNIVSESGLYSLTLGSKKPQAKPFKRWVTHDVIPSIHKTGMYAVNDLLDNPDIAIKAFTALKEEREKRKALSAKVEQDKPKVNFANSVAGSVNSILIRDMAKLLKQNGFDIGEKRLFELLRIHGYLIRKPGRDYNSPTQYSMECGLMEVKETAIDHASGYSETKRTPLITGKGQQYFINKFCKEVENNVESKLPPA